MVFISAIFLGLIVGYLDFVAPPALAFSAFYLIPIVQNTWFVGAGAGFFTAIASAIATYLANPSGKVSGLPPLFSYWNAGEDLIVFATVVYLLSRIKDLADREKKLARTDFTTGVANSRLFFEFADLEIKRASRFKYHFTIAYIDIDNFKKINETLGYRMGDELLKEVAETLKATLRMTDIIARLGGDEFAILLSETGYEPAKIVLNRVHNKLLEAMKFRKWAVTFSIGAATFIQPPNSVEEMIERADNLMYFVKHNGKNMVKHERFGEPPESRE